MNACYFYAGKLKKKKKSHSPDSLAASTLDLTKATVRCTFMAFGGQQGVGSGDCAASAGSASKQCPEDDSLTLPSSW